MQTVVKVEPLVQRLPAKMSEWGVEHLPDGAIGKWRHGFITTFAAYIGIKDSPWELKDEDTLKAMQNCWDHIYQSTIAAGYKITGFRDVVFHLVSILSLVKYTLTEPIG
jgi:hypothetical protein